MAPRQIPGETLLGWSPRRQAKTGETGSSTPLLDAKPDGDLGQVPLSDLGRRQPGRKGGAGSQAGEPKEQARRTGCG